MCSLFLFFLMIRPPPRSALFPYTTLFRSLATLDEAVAAIVAAAHRPTWSVDDEGSVPRLAHGLKGSSAALRLEEHTSELQSRQYLVCRLFLEKKKFLKDTPLLRASAIYPS